MIIFTYHLKKYKNVFAFNRGNVSFQMHELEWGLWAPPRGVYGQGGDCVCVCVQEWGNTHTNLYNIVGF